MIGCTLLDPVTFAWFGSMMARVESSARSGTILNHEPSLELIGGIASQNSISIIE